LQGDTNELKIAKVIKTGKCERAKKEKENLAGGAKPLTKHYIYCHVKLAHTYTDTSGSKLA